ncbi:little elongation complex subunit 1-like [Silurus meridionalis]|uniref:little elongation complex subunit 1-like n=1 Tax=Silurus meridionalis TaxID=175797 RepID=UPI001EEA88FB|nr:little elongation complex subunit 1-like [Silurus meridionalis]
MLNTDTNKNSGIENQFLALKAENTSKHLEIQELKCKMRSLEKIICLMKKKLKNELNKETKSSFTQTDNKQKADKGNQTQTNPRAKRAASDTSQPTTAKRPRIDAAQHKHNKTQSLIACALETLHDASYDLLSTNWVSALLKGSCKLPGLTDEEKSVTSVFCVNKCLTETFLTVILDKIKAEKKSHNVLQFLCRVYVALCQQRGDSHKVHTLAYRLLKEDFPEAPKLIMVMVTAWPCVFSYDAPLCRAIHIVTKMKAGGDILCLLSKYLHWDRFALQVTI